MGPAGAHNDIVVSARRERYAYTVSNPANPNQKVLMVDGATGELPRRTGERPGQRPVSTGARTHRASVLIPSTMRCVGTPPYPRTSPARAVRPTANCDSV